MLITLKGNPKGGNELIADTIKGLEKMEYMSGRKIFNEIMVEFQRSKENNTIFIEKWTLSGEDGSKEYWISFDTTPPPNFPYKVKIEVSEKNPDMVNDDNAITIKVHLD